MKKLLVYSLLGLLILPGMAQFGYYNEALVFSQRGFGGSARIQGIGGARMALGGDISLANSNPAGLGFFNRSTFTLSMALDNYQSTADYFGESTKASKNNFNVSQLGLTFYYGDGELATNDYRGGSLAISVNKVNDFHNKVSYEGYNDYNSIVLAMVEDPGLGYVDGAYENFLVNEHPWNYVFDEEAGEILGYDTVAGFTGLSSPFETSVPYQQAVVETFGGQYSIDVAYGGNYRDIVYFGGGVGIQTLDYERITTYMEDDYFVVTERTEDGIDGFEEDALRDLSIRDRLNISGIGVNANVGMIIRPLPFVTLGIAYQTPTLMSLEEDNRYDFYTTYYDKYDYTLVTYDANDQDADPETRFLYTTYDLGEHEYLSDIFNSTYSLRTPARWNAGVALFLGKIGFLTGDVEYVDYSANKLTSQDIDMGGDNTFIQDAYQSTLNYRLGAEVRLGTVRLRGGYGFQGDTFRSDAEDNSLNYFTGGLGFRNKNFYADLSGQYSMWEDQLSPYSIGFDQPVASVESSRLATNLTLGLSF